MFCLTSILRFLENLQVVAGTDGMFLFVLFHVLHACFVLFRLQPVLLEVIGGARNLVFESFFCLSLCRICDRCQKIAGRLSGWTMPTLSFEIGFCGFCRSKVDLSA